MSSESRKPVSRKTGSIALFLMSSSDLPEQALNIRSISASVSACTITLSGFGVLSYLNGLSIISSSRSNQFKNVYSALEKSMIVVLLAGRFANGFVLFHLFVSLPKY